MPETHPDELGGLEGIVRRLEEELELAEARRDEADGEIARIKQSLTVLRPRASEGPAALSNEGLPPVRPGQWARMSKAAALGAYLLERAPRKIPLKKIAADLLKAGVYQGNPRKGLEKGPLELMEWNVKIALNNGKHRYEYDEKENTAGIRPGVEVHKIRNRPARRRA